MAVRSFRELIAWQKAMNLVELVYSFSSNFPKEEQYGLTSQLRRAAVSIPSNIAEGQGRSTTTDFLRFLAIARGSLFESETQILIAARLSYLNDQQSFELAEAIAETGRLINGLSNSLKEKL